jgi:hypothetical protein
MMSATIVATVVIVDALYDREAMYHGRPCIRILPRERDRERERERERERGEREGERERERKSD